MNITVKLDPLPLNDKWNHEKGEIIEKISKYSNIEDVAKLVKQNPDLVSPSFIKSINNANQAIFFKRIILFGGYIAYCGLQYSRNITALKQASQSVLIRKFGFPLIIPIVLHEWLTCSDKNEIEAAHLNILLRLPRLRYNTSLQEYLS